jgi:hypothetical protein
VGLDLKNLGRTEDRRVELESSGGQRRPVSSTPATPAARRGAPAEEHPRRDEQLLEGVLHELEELRAIMFQGLTTPASHRVIRLTATIPVVSDDRGSASRSVGVLNPSPVTVYLGKGAGEAAPGRDSISIPPSSALVVPIAIMDLEIGADPAALAGGDVVVHLFRYTVVQPLFLRTW